MGSEEESLLSTMSAAGRLIRLYDTGPASQPPSSSWRAARVKAPHWHDVTHHWARRNVNKPLAAAGSVVLYCVYLWTGPHAPFWLYIICMCRFYLTIYRSVYYQSTTHTTDKFLLRNNKRQSLFECVCVCVRVCAAVTAYEMFTGSYTQNLDRVRYKAE